MWQSGDPILGKYLPSGSDSNLPGMGGVYNSFNLGMYSNGHQNPILYHDPDGRRIEFAPGLTNAQRGQILSTMQMLTGDKLFVKGSEIRIAKMGSSANVSAKTSGTSLIRDLRLSGKTVTVGMGAAGSGNSANASNWADAQSGKGSDATVSFDATSNPNILTKDPKTGNVAPQAGRPSQIGLGHELIHADHIMDGTVNLSPASHTYKTSSGNVTQTVRSEELRTVGVAGNVKGDVTENQLRREQGVDERGAY